MLMTLAGLASKFMMIDLYDTVHKNYQLVRRSLMLMLILGMILMLVLADIDTDAWIGYHQPSQCTVMMIAMKMMMMMMTASS